MIIPVLMAIGLGIGAIFYAFSVGWNQGAGVTGPQMDPGPNIIFFLVAAVFFWVSIPAYVIGLILGGMSTTSQTERPHAHTSPETRSSSPGPGADNTKPRSQTTSAYDTWTSTMTPEDWGVFCSLVADDVTSGRRSVGLVESYYPRAAVVPGFRDWLSELAAAGVVH